MGLIYSWVAIRTTAKADVFDHLQMIETAKVIDPVSGRNVLSAHQSDNGWLYVFSDDFDWANQARVLDLSRFGMTLGIQAEDKIDMACVVRAAEGGRELWAVSHVNEAGGELSVSGDAPDALADIRRKYEALQAEENDVDYLWDIPVELARALTGYRVEEDRIDFIELASTRSKSTRKGGLLARFFLVFR